MPAPLCPETRRRQAAATPCDGGGGQHKHEGLAPTRRRVRGGSPGNGQPTWAPRALLCSPGSAGGPTTQRVPTGPVPMGEVRGGHHGPGGLCSQLSSSEHVRPGVWPEGSGGAPRAWLIPTGALGPGGHPVSDLLGARLPRGGVPRTHPQEGSDFASFCPLTRRCVSHALHFQEPL